MTTISMTSRRRYLPLWAKIPLAILLSPLIIFYLAEDFVQDRQAKRTETESYIPTGKEQ
jgi:hypothetical protein